MSIADAIGDLITYQNRKRTIAEVEARGLDTPISGDALAVYALADR